MKRIVLLVSFMCMVGLLFGCGLQKAAENVAGEITNHAPVIDSITASSQYVNISGNIILTCEATDQDGDTISYSWNATAGGLSSTVGKTVTWTAPSSAQTCVITVTISDGRSTASGSITIYVSSSSDTTAPNVPTGLTAKAGNAAVMLTWEANSESDLRGYNIYRSNTSGSDFSKITTSPTDQNRYTDTGLTNGTTYYYKITAVDTSSNESNYSNEVQGTPSSAITTPALSFVKKWGTEGTGNGQFKNPVDVAVYGNYVYVLDHNNARVQKFDRDGNYISQWGSFGSGDSQFKYPQSIAVDSSGNVYVGDTNNACVKKFDGNGNYLSKFGSGGSGDGQFDPVCGVDIDNNGYIYVADAYNHRIQKFTNNGTFEAKWGTLGSGNGQFRTPWEAVPDSNGNVYVADRDNYRVQKFTSTGTFVSKWGSYGTGNGEFKMILRLAIDSNSNIYVSEQENYRIQVFFNDRIKKYISLLLVRLLFKS